MCVLVHFERRLVFAVTECTDSCDNEQMDNEWQNNRIYPEAAARCGAVHLKCKEPRCRSHSNFSGEVRFIGFYCENCAPRPVLFRIDVFVCVGGHSFRFYAKPQTYKPPLTATAVCRVCVRACVNVCVRTTVRVLWPRNGPPRIADPP